MGQEKDELSVGSNSPRRLGAFVAIIESLSLTAQAAYSKGL
jgi:hypothetical protein